MHFSFYLIDADYCNYLRESDPCVPYNMEHKATRPFIGIVFTVNGFQTGHCIQESSIQPVIMVQFP